MKAIAKAILIAAFASLMVALHCQVYRDLGVVKSYYGSGEFAGWLKYVTYPFRVYLPYFLTLSALLGIVVLVVNSIPKIHQEAKR